MWQRKIIPAQIILYGNNKPFGGCPNEKGFDDTGVSKLKRLLGNSPLFQKAKMCKQNIGKQTVYD